MTKQDKTMAFQPPADIPASSLHSPHWCRDHTGRCFTFEESLDLIRSFHGFPAPGLVLGVRMVTHAMDQLPENILFDAISETASCLPDAVQILTLCTIGNAWLKVADLGKFAVTLYDKSTGEGVRVFLDPQKLKSWPEFYGWFYKLKPKKDQDTERLLKEIQTAGSNVLTLEHVQVQPRHLVKRSKGPITTCPECGEAFPAKHGDVCKGCGGESPFQSRGIRNADLPKDGGPGIRLVPLEQAAGKRIVHDMTRIVPNEIKEAAFTKGQTLTAGDICRLQQMGRYSVYVEDETNVTDGWVHENAAAIAFAKAMAGIGVTFDGQPREGKINLSADRDGLLSVDVNRLERFNRVDGVMCASRKTFSRVQKGEHLAATRAIPLFLPESDFNQAMAILEEAPLFRILPLRKAKVGVLVTGTEIFRGVVKDSFIPIITSKLSPYGCEMVDSLIVPDDRPAIRDGITRLIKAGADLIITTAGLSVDPDDVTRLGLMDAGCTDMLYGAPILPGAMTLLGRIGDVQVMGVPACGLYHQITSFDLLLPRLLAGQTLTRSDLAAYGHGGFCQDCKACTFPKCAFGK
ncbi:MAG: FmdE family protein [Desulfosalsimonadaceae bacterium]|nr:FmdE family protein [Desulfosalsimonadaceae bacterium]